MNVFHVRKASSLMKTTTNSANHGLSKCMHTHTHTRLLAWNLFLGENASGYLLNISQLL